MKRFRTCVCGKWRQTQSYTFDPMCNRLTKVNKGVTENNTHNNDLNGNTLSGSNQTNT